MRLGAVFTPSGRGNGSLFREKMRLYQAMSPDVCRVTQYWGQYTDPDTGGIYTPDQLREIVRATRTEIILQSSEVPDSNLAYRQLNALLWLVNEFPTKNFTFEIGNEPDHGEFNGNPGGAADRLVRAAQHLRNSFGGNHYGYTGRGPGNLWYALAQPSGNRPGGGDAWYFDNYNGPVINGERVLDAAEIAAVHCYGDDTLCYRPDYPDALHWKVYRWVRIWKPSKIVKITEAGINRASCDGRWSGYDPYGNYGSRRGYYYLKFAEEICDRADGHWITDVVCFYGLPWTSDDPYARSDNPGFDLRDVDVNQIATRDFAFARGLPVDGGCRRYYASV